MYICVFVWALCIQPTPGSIANKDIVDMSKILEKKVIDEIYSKVYADELQKAYNEVPYRTQTTDGNVLCAGSAAKIAVIVEQKDRILQDIVNHIQNLYQNNPKPKQRMQLDEADNLAHASKIVGIAPTSTLEEDIFATRSLSADNDKVLPNFGKQLGSNHEGQGVKVENNYHFKEEGNKLWT